MTDLPRIDDRYALNPAKVACQVFDGEAIVIHFERGHYFSATGSAALLLALLSDGSSMAELRSLLVRRFGLEVEHAARVVATFWQQLAGEELLVATPGVTAEGSASAADPTPIATFFEEPLLVKHTELEDLLLLDPIHEVMLSAWPAGSS